MDHRIGLESTVGLGGGGISPESLKNYEIGAELARRRQPNEAYPYLVAAISDERNVDACRELSLLQPNLNETLRMLSLGAHRAIKVLKEIFGSKAMDDDGPIVGRFWDVVQTRPYMRVLQTRVRYAFENGNYQDSADTMIEMLRLSTEDRLSQHQWLGSVLCRLGRWSDALYFVQIYSLCYIGGSEFVMPPRGGTVFKSPTKRLCSPEQEKALERVTCWLTYTAALASFRLWGDCEESRQYLRIAVRGNPHVMVKILSKVNRPQTLNTDARTYNGTEDAHDYLWLSQDMWMKPDMYEWVDAQPESHQATFKECGKSDCTKRESRAAEFQRCSSCHQTSYCSRDCQKADWESHREECKFRKLRIEAQRAFSSGQPMPKGTKIPMFAADFSSGVVHMYDGTTATPTKIPEGIPEPSKKKKSKKKKKKNN